MVFFGLDMLVWSYGSTGAVPFLSMLAVLTLWFGISVPLVFLGKQSNSNHSHNDDDEDDDNDDYDDYDDYDDEDDDDDDDDDDNNNDKAADIISTIYYIQSPSSYSPLPPSPPLPLPPSFPSLPGAYFGYKRDAIEFPVITSNIPRQIPTQPWYLHPLLTCLLGGILPFGACFVELFFIMSSIWMDQVTPLPLVH